MSKNEDDALFAMSPAEAAAFAAGMLRDAERAFAKVPSGINQEILRLSREEFDRAVDVYESFRVSKMTELA